MQIETLPHRLGLARPRIALILSDKLTVDGSGRARGLSSAAPRESVFVGGLA